MCGEFKLLLERMPTRSQKTRKNFKKNKITGGNIIIRQWEEKATSEDLKPKIYFTMDNNRKIYEIVDNFWLSTGQDTSCRQIWGCAYV